MTLIILNSWPKEILMNFVTRMTWSKLSAILRIATHRDRGSWAIKNVPMEFHTISVMPFYMLTQTGGSQRQNLLYVFTCSNRHGSRFVTDARSRTGPCLAAVGTLRTEGTRCAMPFRRQPDSNDRWFWIHIHHRELSATANVHYRRSRRWYHRVHRRKRLLRPPRNSIATDAC